MKFSGNVLNGIRKKESRLFKRKFYSQIILGWILMIVQELSSLDGGLRFPSALVSSCTLDQILLVQG